MGFAPRSRLYRAFRRFQRRWRPVPAERPEPTGAVLPEVPRFPLPLERLNAFSHRLSSSGRALLLALRPDAVFNLHTGILRGDVLTLPPLGVWSFHHGDPQRYRGSPPGFWEIYDGAPETGAVLQKLEERLDDGVVLREARFPTLRHSYSAQRNQLFLGSVGWPAEVAGAILDGKPPALARRGPASPAPIRRWPNDLQMLRFLMILAAQKIKSSMASTPAESAR